MQYEQYTQSGRAEFETRGTPGRELDSQSGFSEFCGGRRALLFCRSRRKETLINQAVQRFLIAFCTPLKRGVNERSEVTT